MIAQREIADSFACFGGTCGVLVRGDDEAATAGDAAALVRRRLLAWHDRFTRFDPQSELSRVNADPRPACRSRTRWRCWRTRFARRPCGPAGSSTARSSGGSRRPATAARRARRCRSSWPSASPRPAARRRPTPSGIGARSGSRSSGRLLRRPVGVQIDSGGLAKGLFADLLADALARHDAFAVDCAGDLRLGGTAGESRPVRVASPFHAGMLHTFEVAAGAAATSGIGRRSWLDAGGRPAHHILDPATGRPAFTGIVQATALAPTALDAEVRAKAALLSGPDDAQAWLRHGGVVVLDDGSHRVFPPA
jgi:FAD:protein FMN transferase